MHKGMGSVATVLIQNGTLHLGDAVVFDQFWGRIKTMHNEHGHEIEHAGPSSPVKITGLSGLPEAGSEFIIVKNEKEARELSEARELKERHLALQKKKSGLEGLLQKEASRQEKKVLTLILRADVQGSLEALKHSLEKIVSSKAEINIISSEVGEISESDIQLASASKATIIGFHTQIESRSDSLIKELKVIVRMHDIIYHAVDDVKELLVTLLDKIAQENDIGEAVVKAIFKSSHLGNIAGCQVTDGIIKRSSHVRLVRDKEVIWKGPLASLKRVKEDVREASKGQECGIVFQGFKDVKEGDIIQAFDVSYLTQEL
jgi:translation initiation factor IF-2